MLDIIYIALTLALFALVSLVAKGGGAAVIVFEILAAALAVAAVVYLVVALVAPERF